MQTETRPLHLPSLARKLPEDWIWMRLDEVCSGIFDCPHSTPSLTSEGPLVARSQDILSGTFRVEDAARVTEETYRERIIRAEPTYGDLLYSREGTYFGIAAEVPTKTRVCLGQRMVLLRSEPMRMDFQFLRYWLNSPVLAAHIHGHRDGTVAERLNLPTIRGLPIPVPPIAQQRAVAQILSSFDEKIELNRRMNETLEATGRTIFKSWFVDFDPVHAKAGARQPFGMDAETAVLFPDSFQDSSLGKIPRGWKIGKLAESCSTQYGYTASATEKPIGPKLLRVTDINKTNWIEWDSVPFCHISDVAKSKYALAVGDIVVARMADPGKSAIIEEPVNAVFASYLVRLKTPSLAHAYYTFGFLKSQSYEEYAQGTMSGSVQANMNAKVIVDVDLTIPQDSIIHAYYKTVLPLRKKIATNLTESSTLAGIVDVLLPKLISGEIQTTDTQKLTESNLWLCRQSNQRT
jgi:type I restriction enzyme, S subunit